VVTPTLLEPGGGGKTTLVNYMFESLQGGVEQGQQALADNPKKAPYLVFATDAYSNLPSGRIDAVVQDLRC
jgi:ABC-type amino acid transport substrate-binding protein